MRSQFCPAFVYSLDLVDVTFSLPPCWRELHAYTIYRAGLNNMWKDVGAAAQDIYKPWNPYQLSNPISANSARMARNARCMRATGASGWTVGAMTVADNTGYWASNLAAGAYATKALSALRAQRGLTEAEIQAYKEFTNDARGVVREIEGNWPPPIQDYLPPPPEPPPLSGYDGWLPPGDSVPWWVVCFPLQILGAAISNGTI